MRELGDLINVLSCDITLRPPGAPGFDDLRPRLVDVSRSASKLALTLEASAASELEAFVAAETLCCGGIGWGLRASPIPTLTIEAGETQLDALESMWRSTPA